MRVTILTATLPERADMLAEAVASVQAQDCPGVNIQHLVMTDVDRQGAGVMLNWGLQGATGEKVMVLDDDDLLDPDHVATVLTVDPDFLTVVYTHPRVTGGTFTQYHEDFDARKLAAGHNCVSHNALMPVDVVREVGGWRNVRHFDLDLFSRLEQYGCDFVKIPETTWTYRLHGSNWSQGTLTP